MAYEWAKPGAACVCVDVISRLNGLSLPSLVEGRVYTIEAIGPYPVGRFKGSPCVWLLGVPNKADTFKAFLLERFRPLVSRTQEQDVEMFLSLLNPSPLERLDRLMEIMNE